MNTQADLNSRHQQGLVWTADGASNWDWSTHPTLLANQLNLVLAKLPASVTKHVLNNTFYYEIMPVLEKVRADPTNKGNILEPMRNAVKNPGNVQDGLLLPDNASIHSFWTWIVGVFDSMERKVLQTADSQGNYYLGKTKSFVFHLNEFSPNGNTALLCFNNIKKKGTVNKFLLAVPNQNILVKFFLHMMDKYWDELMQNGKFALNHDGGMKLLRALELIVREKEEVYIPQDLFTNFHLDKVKQVLQGTTAPTSNGSVPMATSPVPAPIFAGAATSSATAFGAAASVASGQNPFPASATGTASATGQQQQPNATPFGFGQQQPGFGGNPPPTPAQRDTILNNNGNLIALLQQQTSLASAMYMDQAHVMGSPSAQLPPSFYSSHASGGATVGTRLFQSPTVPLQSAPAVPFQSPPAAVSGFASGFGGAFGGNTGGSAFGVGNNTNGGASTFGFAPGTNGGNGKRPRQGR